MNIEYGMIKKKEYRYPSFQYLSAHDNLNIPKGFKVYKECLWGDIIQEFIVDMK